MARETWTDERLDDLAKRMDKGFEDAKVEIRDQRAETKAEIRELKKDMNERFGAVEARFNLIETRLDAIPRILVIGLSSMTASIVAAVLAVQL